MQSCSVLVFVIIATTVVLGQLPANSYDILQKCKAKTSATDADLTSVTSRTGQCLAACIEKASGYMNPDNSVNIENVKKFYKPLRKSNPKMYNKLEKILYECAAFEKPEVDECVAAKNFMECIRDKRHLLVPDSPSV